MRKALSAAVFGVVGLMAWSSAAPAHAGWLGNLFGGDSASSERTKAEPGRRTWTVHEFSTISLVASEPGSKPNQHPAEVSPDRLRQQLVQLRYMVGASSQPLFASDEVGELVEPLVQAFGSAGPGDDVLLVSSARRGDAVMFRPVAVTARLFIQDGSLQFIANDARFEFYDNFRGSRKPPEFTYGSRSTTGKAVLRSESASSVRADWLAIPLTGTAAAPTAAVVPTVAAPAGQAPAAAAAAPGPVTAAPAAPVLRPREPGFADEVEQRLVTLKRLRDRGLISEEEYQQKRREILQQL
jgi:hypothetical protein